jgi:hydrogenase expression/formation protein HypC
MCLSIPAKVVSVTGQMADVSVGGSVFKAGLQLLENIQPGDYILLHAGFGIQKISEDEALVTLKLLDEINAAQLP